MEFTRDLICIHCGNSVTGAWDPDIGNFRSIETSVHVGFDFSQENTDELSAAQLRPLGVCQYCFPEFKRKLLLTVL